MGWVKWVWETLFGGEALRWPRPGWGWLAFVPALALSVALGVVSAVVSSPLWLPIVLLALAPVALIAAWWVSGL